MLRARTLSGFRIVFMFNCSVKDVLHISDDIMILDLMSSSSNGFFLCKIKVKGEVVGSRPTQGVCVDYQYIVKSII